MSPRSGPGPDTLAQVAAELPEGSRRASVHLVEQSLQALERRELAESRGLAERALRLDGRNAYAFYALARVRLAERDPEGATQDIDQAETLLRASDPRNERWRGKLLRLRAAIRWLRHDTLGARELQEFADVLDPGGSMPGTPPPHLLESPR